MEQPAGGASHMPVPVAPSPSKRLADAAADSDEAKRVKLAPAVHDDARSGVPVPGAAVPAPAAAKSPPTRPAHTAGSTSSSKAATPVSFAVSEDPGRRISMEDAWAAELDARRASHASTSSGGGTRVSFFGVFDGHAGRNSATYAAEHIHHNVMAAGLVPEQVASGEQALDIKAARRAIIQGFADTDAAVLELCREKNWQDGAAAVCVWVVGDTVLVANLGDCKCILARTSDKEGSRGQLRALTLTKDHLAIYPDERTRIQKAGGSVSADGRLNGRLQVARSFGDVAFKKSGASALPSIQVFTITERDRFLLCACDGFWSVFDAQGAVDFMAGSLIDGRDDKAATNRTLHEAVRERKCTDNATLMLIRICHVSQGG